MEQQLRSEINQLILKLSESKLKTVLNYVKEVEKTPKKDADLARYIDQIFEEDAGLLKKLAQ